MRGLDVYLDGEEASTLNSSSNQLNWCEQSIYWVPSATKDLNRRTGQIKKNSVNAEPTIQELIETKNKEEGVRIEEKRQIRWDYRPGFNMVFKSFWPLTHERRDKLKLPNSFLFIVMKRQNVLLSSLFSFPPTMSWSEKVQFY